MRNFEDSEAPLEFPRDEGAHEGVKHEWWYFNGHVRDTQQHAFGLMVCFFNNGRLYLGVTDEDHNDFSRHIVDGPLNAAAGRLDVSIGKNRWVEKDTFAYEMHIEHGRTRLALRMKAERPPLVVGGKGIVRMGKGGTSYYYSQTRLRIDGRLMLHGKEREISGAGWIDRQWGDWDYNGFAGWEWFSVQLDDGSDIHLAHVFDPQTKAPITPRVDIMHADGTQETLDSYDVEYLDYWTHPETGDTFAHKWRVKIPGKDIDLVVTPTVDRQIIYRGLWEGSCKVSGTAGGKAVGGDAYVELLHQRRKMRLMTLARQLVSMSRMREWWDKLNTVLSASLVLLILNPCPAECFWMLPVLAVYMAFLSSYGFAINAYTDREEDKKVGKLKELDSVSDRHLLLVTCFFALGALLTPLLFFDSRTTLLGLTTFFVTTFYSLKPIRFKVRGILGIIVAAAAQRPLPFLFFVLLLAPHAMLSWYLLGWLMTFGLTAMFAHQVQDFRNDEEAGVSTWARRVGFYRAKRVTLYFFLLTMAYIISSLAMFGINNGLLITVVLFMSSASMIGYTLKSIRQVA